MVLSAGTLKSETVDEGLFIAGGTAQVHHLDPNIDLTHPPLLRWLSGVPAVLFGHAHAPEPVPFVPRGPMDLFSYKVQDVFDYGQRFFYEASNAHDRVLFWGRFPFALVGALLGWLVFLEARRLLGPVPALAALLTFSFTPEVLAHAQWAHSDLASGLTLWLVAIALARALSSPSWRTDLMLGGAMGLAVAVKLTAIVLWPVILALIALFRRKHSRSLLRGAGVALAIFYGVVVAVYLPAPRAVGPHEFRAADLARLHLDRLEPLLAAAPLPDTFLKGIVYTGLLGQRGQVAYFHGQKSSKGWWYYFPAAMFLKYPTGLLLLALVGLILLWRGEYPAPWKVALTLPPLAILGAAMLQSINVGVRSVLPLAPFLAFWSATTLAHSRTMLGRGIVVLLVASSVASGVAAYPDFLAYFNPLLGGTAAADRWLVDSNLDWGQDLPELARELGRRRVPAVRLAYFGVARPDFYGINALDARTVAPGWYAISRSYLSGWWPPGDPYAWLRDLRPVTLVGGSIALYHVSEAQADAAMRARASISGGERATSGGASQAALMQAGLDALYTQGLPEVAAAEFRKVLALNPTHYGAMYQLATALDRAGHPIEARPLWEKVLTMARGYGDTATAETARGRLEGRP
jgi:hypothetical protein